MPLLAVLALSPLLAPVAATASTQSAGSNAAQRSATGWRPRTLHRQSRYSGFDYELPIVRLVLKLHDDLDVDTPDGLAVIATDAGRKDPVLNDSVRQINSILRLNGWKAAPMLRLPRTVLDDARSQAERYWQHRVADLSTYLQIPVRPGESPERLRAAVQAFARLPSLEIAYPQTAAVPMHGGPAREYKPPLALDSDPDACAANPLPPQTEDMRPLQNYLDPAPLGIDVAAAHAQPGGRGEHVMVMDMEAAFHPHSEFPALAYVANDWDDYTIGVWSNIDNAFVDRDYGVHGTEVLGILAAADDGRGVLGIVPNAKLGFHSLWDGARFENYINALEDPGYGEYENLAEQAFIAAWNSHAGVLLLEVQRPGDSECGECGNGACQALPVEVWPDTYDVIQYVTSMHVVVVEAAGNGSRDIDSALIDFDSGAIMVTGSKMDGQTPFCEMNGGSFANIGARIDVHAWGEGVVTTSGPGCHSFTEQGEEFNGSSSASAIVAGAAASLQSIYRAAFDGSMDPKCMRNLLRFTGTPQAPGTEQWPIGTQPDLAQAIAKMTLLGPDSCYTQQEVEEP